MNWNYTQPVEIHFGSGRLSELPNLLSGAARPFLVTTERVLTGDRTAKLAAFFDERDIFTDVSPNPDVSQVNRCSRQIRARQNDLIVAVGGGSVIDLAKSASVTVEDIRDYHGTGRHVPDAHLPIIAVPTTAGTGSEVTNASVLTNRETGQKAPIGAPVFFPKIALVDPELTVSMPRCITASSGIDVLCHAVEGYWSTGHQPVCDALAVHAAKLVLKYLPLACEEPEHLTYRENMAEASLTAGLAFSLPKTTSSHACSFPLTSLYHIPHGEACGLTLDFFTRVNAADERTGRLAEELGFPSAEALADGIFRLKKSVGLRTDLSDFALTDRDIDALVAKSHHPNLSNNPVTITDEHLYALYRSLQ